MTGDDQPEPHWKYLPLVLVLALAFAARAAVADEIMQYLEPAHRLAFGNGVIYWEYFYGARSWLVPGVVAGVLKLFDLVGLGQPWWYVGGVKLLFCALSLALCLRPNADGSRVVWQAAGLAVLVAAIRLQYAPLALLLLGIVLLRTRDRLHLVLAAVVLLFAVGVFDGLTWGRGLFQTWSSRSGGWARARRTRTSGGSRWAAAG